MNYKYQLGALSKKYEQQLHKFLRDMISIPSLSCDEAGVIERIKQEMEALEYDEIIIDKMGNILGRMGSGKKVIAFDGHIDTVDVGVRENWTFDPFEGKEDDLYIYGRGASDQEGGFASAVYGAKFMKELGLLEDHTVWVVGSIQEEDCDGLCWQYILNEKIIEPEFVVSTEPTGLNIYRGQRGRMEILVEVKGTSAHGSAPERGDNAIYKMAKIITELEQLNETLKHDDFLGKGTLVVSQIFYSSPSRCAVADGCSISIDRRLTFGESEATAIGEINALESVKNANANVSMYRYERPSYKDLKPDVACYFPTWVIPEEHKLCKDLLCAYDYLFEKEALLDKWTFSTNGVSIMGMYNVPCIGFGPGLEEEAHAPNEKILKSDLVEAAMFYALIPLADKGDLCTAN
ncbi:MAG: YgeY family selenium metabolism-linked hydrolase [Clostridiales bacterium]|nr:YgeY family selenium metabolism-linked hydrolase [Clostridiales bacterium]